MSSLGVWTVLIILYQTIFCVTVSLLVLDCKYVPDKHELHEVTMMKFLYLYDPKSCGKVYVYNITNFSEEQVYGNIVWPLRNKIAASFRTKIQVWLSFHLLWLLFAIINVTQGERPCSFYATQVPFTLIGTALLVIDVVYACLFIIDAKHTATEAAIIAYVSQEGHLRAINERPLTLRRKIVADTSWISLLLAFVSLRGIIQWIFNFWIVKDNFYEGLERYRHMRFISRPKRSSRKSSRCA